MARHKLSIELDPIVAAVGRGPVDDLDELLLDATASLLVDFGLRRWSVGDVAERAGVGRTSVYRRVASRDDLVHGVLARELRLVLAAVDAAGRDLERIEDRVVEAVSVCLAAVDGSVVGHLIRTDPTSVLPLLTTGAGPLLALARTLLAPALVDRGIVRDPDRAAVLAEAIARLGLSFLLTPDTVLPVADPVERRDAIRSLLGPILRPA